MHKFKTHMEQHELPKPVIDNFLRLLKQVIDGKTGEIRESEIESIQELPRYEDILNYKQKGIEDYFIGARSNIKDLISEYKNIDEPNLVLSENNQENLYHLQVKLPIKI